jgi:hypothetical protein
MSISKQTMTILKNFAQINNSLIVDEKFVLKSGKGEVYGNKKPNILAVADIPEELPEFFCYDLNKLLSSINMFDLDKLEITFDEKYIILNHDHRTIKIQKSMPEEIPFRIEYTAEKIKNPAVKYNVTFDMSSVTIKNIKNATNTFKTQEKHLKVEVTNGKGIVKVTNFENSSSDIYTETFNDDIDGNNCSIIIDLNDFIILDGDYEVSICNEKVMKLYNKDLKLTYQIVAMKIREEK